MLRRARHRLCHRLHIGSLLVFALCLAVQPVTVAWGEMHEIADHADSAHVHPDHTVLHDDGQAGGTDQDGPLHLLLHYAHCFGQTIGAVAEGLEALTAVCLGSQLLPLVTARLAVSFAGTPFRAPIAA